MAEKHKLASGVEPARSLGERVIAAGVSVAAAQAAAKVLGLVQARVFGHYFGAGEINDAFVFVFEQILLNLFFIGEETLGPAFLPLFMERREKSDEKSAWRFASTLLQIQVLVLSVIVALLMLFPEWVINHASLIGADEKTAATRLQLASGMLGAMAPALLGLSLGSTTYMLLNGYKRFFWAAFAEVAMKAALVGSFLAVMLLRPAGTEAATVAVTALAVGTVIAGTVKLLVHLAALNKKCGLLSLRPDFSDPTMRRFFGMMALLLVGSLVAKTRDYFNYAYVLSEQVGLLTTFSYGRKIYNTLGSVIPFSLAVAMFPFFCELVDRHDREALGRFIDKSLRMLLLVFMPLALTAAALSAPLAAALFETGKFDTQAVRWTAAVNACCCLALPFYVVERVLMKAFFSDRRILAVTVIGFIFSVLSMIVSGVGILWLGCTGVAALMVVALGWAGTRALKTIALAVLLKRNLHVLPLKSTALFLARAGILSLACAGAAWTAAAGVERFLPATSAERNEIVSSPAFETTPAPAIGVVSNDPAFDKPAQAPKKSGRQILLRRLPSLAAATMAAMIVFLCGCRLLRLTELDEMVRFAREKMRRKNRSLALTDGSKNEEDARG